MQGERVISRDYRYQAFISYAHKDELLAARLHRALETYKIPKNLKLKNGKGLSPIFRDAAELTAHHSLSEKIQEAVQSSRVLIVLCSPAAKQSHWVNEEIRLFRSLHGEGAILCVLAEGTPETSFPPALLEGGREPLAANLSGGRESFRLGVTQLAASMLGVGLDELIQRDTKRRRNRFRILSGASLIFAAIMGGMAWTAIDARDAAEVSRTEAEKMVEFMLTDLKQDLEPVGKLNILDDVGKRVTDYYNAIPFSDMDDDRLARQARARHLLGQVALDQRKMEKAKTEIEAAYEATQEILRRNPDDTAVIFAHAQSAYWVGEMAYISKNYKRTLLFWQEYDALGESLYTKDKNNLDWIMEAAWGQNNLAKIYGKLQNSEIALGYFDKSLSLFSKAQDVSPGNSMINIEKANTLAGKAAELLKLKRYKAALRTRLNEIYILESLKNTDRNIEIDYRLLQTKLIYWEVKNTIEKKCNTQKPIEILQQLNSFHSKDFSNRRWKINYLVYWHDFLTQCQKDIYQDELNTYIDKLLKFAQSHDLDNHDSIRELMLLKE